MNEGMIAPYKKVLDRAKKQTVQQSIAYAYSDFEDTKQVSSFCIGMFAFCTTIYYNIIVCGGNETSTDDLWNT